jgi:hypothetical protein
MALTVTNVSTPNALINEFSFGPYKARLVDIAFDNSYLTTGEVLTAASLGWVQVFGAIVLTEPTNSAGTLMLPVVVKKNTANSQLTFQLYRYDGGAGGKASLEEAAPAFDASTFTGRFLILGY